MTTQILSATPAHSLRPKCAVVVNDRYYVDFNHFINEFVAQELHHKLWDYYLYSEFTFKNMSTKIIFYNIILTKIISFIINNHGKCKHIICFGNIYTNDITKVIGIPKYQRFIKTLFKKLDQLLPNVFIEVDDFELFIQDITNKTDPSYSFANQQEVRKSVKNENYSFKALKNFLKRYEMTHLHQYVINDFKTNSLLFL